MGKRVDLPILFSTPLVPRIIDGTKTETRRMGDLAVGSLASLARRWRSGDDVWLYVREAFKEESCGCESEATMCHCRQAYGPPDTHPLGVYPVSFAADGYPYHADEGPWRPGIHMPKWAATLWLRVAEVRVEALESVTDESALAEGVVRKVPYPYPDGSTVYVAEGSSVPWSTARKAFVYFFRRSFKIHPEANPLLWVIRWDKVEKGQREVGRG